MTITTPTNSFVQVDPPESSAVCAVPKNVCLPVYSVNDISFQMQVVAGQFESTTLYARIVPDCDTPIPPSYNGFTSGVFNQFLLSTDGDGNKTYLMTVKTIGATEFAALGCDQCFYIQIVRKRTVVVGENDYDVYEVVGCTNCFRKICSPCWTSVLSYRGDEDSFGFRYVKMQSSANVLANYYNTVRLPFYLTKPQFQPKNKVFMRSDGSRKKLSSRVTKEYTAKVDWLTADMYEHLAMALEHDTVMIESTDANVSPAQEFTSEGGIQINWQDFLNFPTAPATFKVNPTPYNNYNSNC